MKLAILTYSHVYGADVVLVVVPDHCTEKTVEVRIAREMANVYGKEEYKLEEKRYGGVEFLRWVEDGGIVQSFGVKQHKLKIVEVR